MSYTFFYTITFFLNVVSFYYALKTWKDADDLFCKTHWKNLFDDEIEQKFWMTILGGSASLSMLVVKPFYILNFGANATDWQEPLWLYFHMSVGVILSIYHYNASVQVKRAVCGRIDT